VENNNVGSCTLWYGHNAEVGTAGSGGLISTGDSTHANNGGIDGARHSIAAGARTFNLDAKTRCRLGKIRVGILWIPPDLCEGVAVAICVGAGDIGCPVSERFRSITPDASFFNRKTRVVDIITIAR
jgi:hypothetical protein